MAYILGFQQVRVTSPTSSATKGCSLTAAAAIASGLVREAVTGSKATDVARSAVMIRGTIDTLSAGELAAEVWMTAYSSAC